MASPFDQLAKATQAVIASQIGDVVTFIAFTGGDFSNTEDPERPRFDTVAVLSRGNTDEGIAKSTSSSRVNVQRHRASVDASAAVLLPWLPKRDDRMRQGSTEYRVSSVNRTVLGELVIDLERKGST